MRPNGQKYGLLIFGGTLVHGYSGCCTGSDQAFERKRSNVQVELEAAFKLPSSSI